MIININEVKPYTAYTYRGEIYPTQQHAELRKLSDELDPLVFLLQKRDSLLRQKQRFKNKLLPAVFKEYCWGYTDNLVISDMHYNSEYGISIFLGKSARGFYSETSTVSLTTPEYSRDFFDWGDADYIYSVMQKLLKFKLKTYISKYCHIKDELKLVNERIVELQKHQKSKCDKI